MKQIGAEIGVNESRVSQLHARAIQRLQKALGGGFSTTSLAALPGGQGAPGRATGGRGRRTGRAACSCPTR